MKFYLFLLTTAFLFSTSCDKSSDQEVNAGHETQDHESFSTLITEQSTGGHDLAKFLNSGTNAVTIDVTDFAEPNAVSNEMLAPKSSEVHESSHKKNSHPKGGVNNETEISSLKKLITEKDKAIASLNLLNDELLDQIKKIRKSIPSSSLLEVPSPSNNRLEALNSEIANLRQNLLSKSVEIENLSSLNDDLVSRISSLSSTHQSVLVEDLGISQISSSGFSATPGGMPKAGCSLEFDAVVTMQNGKNKEIFYTEFFLLIDNLSSILSSNGIVLTDYEQVYSVEELMAKSRKSPFMYPGLYKRIRNALLKEIEGGKGRRVRTDIDGFAKIDELERGNYFLLGLSQMGKVGTVWNVPLLLRNGQNKLSLTLDNSSWSN